MLAFVAAVGNALRSHGYYIAVNASGDIPGDSNSDDGTNAVTWWRQLGPHVNGLMDEHYQETSDGSNTLRSADSSWDGWQRLVGTAQSMGDDFFGVTYGSVGDAEAMVYGKASFLLDWDGGGGAFMWVNDDGSDPTNSAWTTDIGQPLDARRQVGAGWLRRYGDGVVLVNPGSRPQKFQLGGRYVTPSGATVTAVMLRPVSAMLLTLGKR
jgi:hypothetical protein